MSPKGGVRNRIAEAQAARDVVEAKAARVHIAMVAFAAEWRTVVLDPARRIP